MTRNSWNRLNNSRESDFPQQSQILPVEKNKIAQVSWVPGKMGFQLRLWWWWPFPYFVCRRLFQSRIIGHESTFKGHFDEGHEAFPEWFCATSLFFAKAIDWHSISPLVSDSSSEHILWLHPIRQLRIPWSASAFQQLSREDHLRPPMDACRQWPSHPQSAHVRCRALRSTQSLSF